MSLLVLFIISILKRSDNYVCNQLQRTHSHETYIRASDLRALVNAVMNLRPRSHVPVFDRPVADRTGESTTCNFKTSPVLTGRSNDQERCDKAVVRAQ